MFSFLKSGNASYEKVFFDFNIKDINNEKIDLSIYKNKIILLVNVASNCGFTQQYSELQELYEKYKNSFDIYKKRLNFQSAWIVD